MKTKIVFLFIATSIFVACNQGTQTTNNEEVKNEIIQDLDTLLHVYYFHATRRCATCQAVEDVTREALKEFYGDKITLLSLNFEEDSNKALVDKFQVSGQTLLIVKGDKQANITEYAFMNAKTQPDKLKEKIKSTIESMR
ncbi:MAG: nitrophenyl compound nitroreductase subunit ArsF family protein [candidate division WOR-3 bacterium]